MKRTEHNYYKTLTTNTVKINYLMRKYVAESTHDYTILVFIRDYHNRGINDVWFKVVKNVPHNQLTLTRNEDDGGDRVTFKPRKGWINKQIATGNAHYLCEYTTLEKCMKDNNFANKGWAYEKLLHDYYGVDNYKVDNADHRTAGKGDLMINGIEYEIKGAHGNFGKEKYLHK